MTYENFLHKVEEVVEDTAGTWGFISTRTAPLGGPMASGLAIMFAFYDGGGSLLQSIGVPLAFTVALLVGMFVAVNLEGLTITHMVIGDRMRSAIQRNPGLSNILDVDKASANKTGLLWFTLIAILMLETVPAALGLYAGEVEWKVAVFRMGLIVFPWLSRNASSAYSLLRLLDEVDPSESVARTARRQRKVKEKLDEQALLADFTRNQQLEDAKFQNRLGKVSQPKGNTFMKASVKASTSGESVGESKNNTFTASDESFHESIDESIHESIPLGKRIVNYLIENPGAKLGDIAAHVGMSEPTVSREVKPLIDMGVLHSQKEGRRNILTVNGGHKEYLAG